jgi:aspartokinase/homoserine dehydrogenase 1
MIVVKFGGSSVGTAESIKVVGDILIEKSGIHDCFVVVSAVGGVTNKLIEMAHNAEKGVSDYETLLKETEEIHLSLVKALIPVKLQSSVLGGIKLIINELEEVLRGIFVLKENSSKSFDFVCGIGERLSSLIIYKYLHGLSQDITLVDPTKIIICTNEFGTGEILIEKSKEKARSYVSNLKKINICPGFIAGTLDGNFTTLGRGGADYTAALFANFYKVSELQIWSDVSGLMTADPKLVAYARTIPQLSYEDALELSHFGAKVIYPPTIQPALEENIPIIIKNTFNPEDLGTKITKSWEDQSAIKGISSINDISLINLSGSGMVGIPSFCARLFQALADRNINVIIITQASSEHTICVGVQSKDEKNAIEEINTAFISEISAGKINPIDVEVDFSIVALVGSNMKSQVGISGQMFSILGKNGINIKAIAQGSSERNITVVIQNKYLKKAINALHESFFVNEIKQVKLFIIGLGNVGKAFLNQIALQKTYLFKEFNLEFQIIGVANSRKMVFNEEGLDPLGIINTIASGDSFQQSVFIDKMRQLNLRNSIFIDITASGVVAEAYEEILKETISVVTPNKIAATRSFAHYQLLKSTANKFKSQFLFETNVGAGLPVLSTLSDLVKSGDRIIKIEAVLSGTLNFIFNNYNAKRSFVEVVKKAKKEGYTEPDPRLDLSGEDVMRKILILARESGYQFDFEDVVGNNFLPKICQITKGEKDFYIKLAENEGHFATLYDQATSKSCKLRYVATFENQKLTTGLSQIGETHPFYQLEGKDNIVLFYTERYPEQPLVIKGAGAGAEVTASGIFADVMRVTNSQN